MKAHEIMEALFATAPEGDYSKSCDTLKAGDPNRETGKVAVSMFATPDVVREAAAWGAELLIVHEPTYYNHYDRHSDEKIENEKRRLIEESNLLSSAIAFLRILSSVELLINCSGRI